ncbi:MAG: YeeE/YedE family protein, partial [Candidatus Puniceispirillaceae bacterium]
MSINWIEFTPFASLFGGIAIGVAALFMWLLLGRIMGVSGILGQAVAGEGAGQNGWRVAFIIGVVGAPFGFMLVAGDFTSRMVASPVGL